MRAPTGQRTVTDATKAGVVKISGIIGRVIWSSQSLVAVTTELKPSGRNRSCDAGARGRRQEAKAAAQVNNHAYHSSTSEFSPQAPVLEYINTSGEVVSAHTPQTQPPNQFSTVSVTFCNNLTK